MDDKEKAQQILQAYENGGSFYSYLYKAVIHADSENLKQLKIAFPVLVDAYCFYTGIVLDEVAV